MIPKLELEIRTASMADYDAVCALFRELDALHVELLPQIFQAYEGPARSVENLRKGNIGRPSALGSPG